MKTKLILLLLILVCLHPVLVNAKGEDACHYSTEGTDFWFGFLENRLKGNTHYLEITVTSRVSAEVTLTYGPKELYIDKKIVEANRSIKIPIDPGMLEPSGSETPEGKGIHLTSDFPVSVYALNYRTQSSDVAVIYPTRSLGKEYLAMCYSPNHENNSESNSQFMIVATEDNTTVKITPSVDTDKGKKAKVQFSVTLNKGQLYQVQSMNQPMANQGDLTGSLITADKPVAFYSGTKSTAVPNQNVSRDHLYEQIPPTSSWGREFYVIPLKLRPKDTYRILAAEDNTLVIIEGINLKVTLNKGEYKEFDLSESEACRIISTKRVLVAQYCRSQSVDGPNGVGDPFMIIISPVVQKISDVTFEAYRSNLITSIFYVNIITKTSEVNELTLDGYSIRNQFKAFPDGKYSYAQVPVESGTRRLKSNLPEGGFLAFVYGFGSQGSTESYGYGVGFNLDIQLDIGGSLENKTFVICKGQDRKLDAGDYFTTYNWSTGETGSSIRISKEGWVKVRASTELGCVKTDSVLVQVDDPKVDLIDEQGSCEPGEIVLVAQPGFAKYLWQDGSVNQSYVVERTGTYRVTVTNENGCSASDEVEAVVFEPSYTQNYSVATDQHPEISFTNQTKYAISYLWNFGDGATSTEASPVHRYNQPGDYTVTLAATSEFGCSDTIRSSVRIIPFKLLTPNAFRPDSNITENRVFCPIAEGADPESYCLQIFSRTGSTVYETRNPETGWDGTLSNGSLAGPGIYIWLVKYLDVQGYPHQEKGTVMLVR